MGAVSGKERVTGGNKKVFAKRTGFNGTEKQKRKPSLSTGFLSAVGQT